MHRPIGAAKNLGIHITNNIARHIGEFILPEDSNEKKNLENFINRFLTEKNRIDPLTVPENLSDILASNNDWKSICVETEAIASDKLAKNLFPKIFDTSSKHVDKDGLASLDYINEHFDEIQPGVFQSNDNQLCIYAHHFSGVVNQDTIL